MVGTKGATESLMSRSLALIRKVKYLSDEDVTSCHVSSSLSGSIVADWSTTIHPSNRLSWKFRKDDFSDWRGWNTATDSFTTGGIRVNRLDSFVESDHMTQIESCL